MNAIKAKVIVGNTELGQSTYERLRGIFRSGKLIEVNSLNKADVRIVFGGDGSILHEVRNDLRSNIQRVVPIFGIKAGNPKSKGMLLNDIADLQDEQIINEILNSNEEKFRYLRLLITTNRGKIIETYAFNDVSLIRARAQTAVTQVILNDRVISERAMGDGFIICTPQGSAAYNVHAGGVVAAALETIQITGNNSSFGNLVLDNNNLIVLNILDPTKRPQKIEVDGRPLSSSISSVQVSISDKFSILKFIRSYGFKDKLVDEAIRKM